MFQLDELNIAAGIVIYARAEETGIPGPEDTRDRNGLLAVQKHAG